MVSLNKKGNTSIRYENGEMIVRLRINQAMEESEIPIGVYQKNYKWFVVFTSSEKPDIEFLDNMIIDRLANTVT